MEVIVRNVNVRGESHETFSYRGVNTKNVIYVEESVNDRETLSVK